MSFTDRAILWLHIGVAIFTIGPVTAAIMSTPRYIRKRNAVVVGFLHRMTWMYGVASLLVFIFGAVLASMQHKISQPWVSISMTLFVVALVLMYLIARDQGKAVEALDREAQAATAAKAPVPATAAPAVPAGPASGADVAETAREGETDARDGKTAPQPAASVTVPSDVREDDRIAAVERGRIASMGGITAIIWIVVLILMVWK